MISLLSKNWPFTSIQWWSTHCSHLSNHILIHSSAFLLMPATFLCCLVFLKCFDKKFCQKSFGNTSWLYQSDDPTYHWPIQRTQRALLTLTDYITFIQVDTNSFSDDNIYSFTCNRCQILVCWIPLEPFLMTDITFDTFWFPYTEQYWRERLHAAITRYFIPEFS